MASYLSSSHWIVAVPNELGSAKAALDCFAKGMLEAGAGRNLGDVCALEVPQMKVGSLDMLMALSDELSRADSFVENVVRKVERQVVDTHLATKAGEANRATGNATPVAVAPLPFLIDGIPVNDYIRRFLWDSEQFDSREALPELLKRLVVTAGTSGRLVKAAEAR
jgi:V-type H+-transporting ATPase subunit C